MSCLTSFTVLCCAKDAHQTHSRSISYQRRFSKLEIENIPTDLPFYNKDVDLKEEENKKSRLYIQRKSKGKESVYYSMYEDIEELRKNQDGRQGQGTKSKLICAICLDDFDADDFLCFRACKEKFHVECVKMYIMEESKIKAFPIRCPNAGCLKELHEEDIKNALQNDDESQGIYDKYYNKYMAEKHPKKYKYCPESSCEYVFCVDPKPKDKKLDCPKCQKDYCIDCEHPWHGSKNCKRAKKQRDKKDDVDFIDYAKTNKFRRCPHCGQVIEKITGCCAITCSRCRGKFCYTCGSKGDGHECKHRRLILNKCSIF